MPEIDLKHAGKELDRWARMVGYNDFDTYIAAGNTVGEAREDLERRRSRLHLAMVALYRWTAPPAPEAAVKQPELIGDPELDDYERANARMTIGPDALARAEAEVIGDPVDPHNAQIQGAEDEG